MIEDNIENIRINVISEIKEKIKKNRKYVHPCNKDFQDDINKYGFKNGNEFVVWMQYNGILKNPVIVRQEIADIRAQKAGFKNRIERVNKLREKLIKDADCKNRKEYRDKCAQIYGYKNRAEQDKVEYFWNKGISLPEEFNESCASYFGKWLGERLFKKFLEENIFEDVTWMGGEQDKGIDFICKNPKQEFIDKYLHLKLERNKEYKIQLRVRCLLNDSVTPRWKFVVGYNNTIDYYILCGFDNREELNVLHVWMFYKDDIIRKNRFWKRESISITDASFNLEEFRSSELIDELVILKELCEELKEEI